jgi:hypothetical protein
VAAILAVAQSRDTLFLGAVIAAIEGAIGLQTVADDANTTVLASGGQSVDGTLKAVKDVALAAHDHLKRLVIVVTATLTLGHGSLPIITFTRRYRAMGTAPRGIHTRLQSIK